MPHNNDEAILDRSTPSLGGAQRSECGGDEHCTVWDSMGPIHFLKTSLPWRAMLEALLPHCRSYVAHNGDAAALSEAHRHRVEEASVDMARRGLPAPLRPPRPAPCRSSAGVPTHLW